MSKPTEQLKNALKQYERQETIFCPRQPRFRTARADNALPAKRCLSACGNAASRWP